MLGVIFARYVLLTSQNPYPIIVYSVPNYKPHLSHFWSNVIFRDPSLGTFYLPYQSFNVWTQFFRLNEEHFTFPDLHYKRSGTFASRKYEELSYVPDQSENM